MREELRPIATKRNSRVTLRLKKLMKKTVLIAVLALVTVVSLIYGYTQGSAAEKAQHQAELRYLDAEKLMRQAKKEATLSVEVARMEAENARRAELMAKAAQGQAEENQRLAEAARRRAEKAENDCGKKK
jgi:hypothetical protein